MNGNSEVIFVTTNRKRIHTILSQLKDQNRVVRIESDFKYNCEHAVPQSWFHEKEPMRGDLHHLFTCAPTCNSIRSNYPY